MWSDSPRGMEPRAGPAAAAHLLSCSTVRSVVVTTSVAWEGWSLLSVTAGTSVGTRGHWGGPDPAPAAPAPPTSWLVPASTSTTAAPWQDPAMGNITPRASPTHGRTPAWPGWVTRGHRGHSFPHRQVTANLLTCGRGCERLLGVQGHRGGEGCDGGCVQSCGDTEG